MEGFDSPVVSGREPHRGSPDRPRLRTGASRPLSVKRGFHTADCGDNGWLPKQPTEESVTSQSREEKRVALSCKRLREIGSTAPRAPRMSCRAVAVREPCMPNGCGKGAQRVAPSHQSLPSNRVRTKLVPWCSGQTSESLELWPVVRIRVGLSGFDTAGMPAIKRKSGDGQRFNPARNHPVVSHRRRQGDASIYTSPSVVYRLPSETRTDTTHHRYCPVGVVAQHHTLSRCGPEFESRTGRIFCTSTVVESVSESLFE